MALQPLDVAACTVSTTNLRDADCDGEPRLEILEQPRQRGQRFRYECEGRSAGSILGENSTEQHKTYTAVQVLNYAGRVRLVMSLLTHEPPFRPHPHSLVGKNCEDGVCILELDPPNLYVQFQNLGIQCVKRKHVFDAIKQRLIRRIDPYNVGGRALKMENLHMNAVRLCWQAYLLDNHGNVLRALPPVLSNPIYDKKGTNTSELRISRLNINHGSVAGGDECFILCDKVQKEDIEVVFSHGSWTELADLSQTDVHRQVAIVFRTPPFYQRDITAPVHVRMQLRRPSDRVVSEAVSFFYTPLDSDPHQLVVKRRRKPLYNLMKSPYHKEVENKDSSRWESNGGMDTAKHKLKIKLQQRELEMRTTLTNKASVAIAGPYNSTQPCEDWEASTSSTMVFQPQTSHYIPPSALASGSSWEGSCGGDLLPGMPQEGEAILNRALTAIDDALCRYDGTFMPPMEGYMDQIHSGTAHVQTMHSALPSEPGGSHQGIIPFSGLEVADWGSNYETNSCEVPFKRPAGAYGTTF
uniref:V-rel avian reticuloendotheliosis viral oncogene homolog n=1 Tax=Eptatretus burgeri TaxID=7764 RepID=A0A8C4R0K0_EPTBU